MGTPVCVKEREREIILLCFIQGDVWICMELMDTSLDKFYKKVNEKGRNIPEDILGKITVAVRPVSYFALYASTYRVCCMWI